MSDLFGNHIVGFPTRWLNYIAENPVGIVSIIKLRKFTLFINRDYFVNDSPYFIICAPSLLGYKI